MDLREWVLHQLAKTQEPDPHVIARRLLARFPKEHDPEARLTAVTQLVMELRRFDRMSVSSSQTGVGMGTPRRVVTLAKARYIAGVWKAEDDCSWEDFIVKAEEYDSESEAAAAKAEECRRLAAAIQAAGVTTLGELKARKKKAA